MNMNAKSALNFFHNKRSGARINSKEFIVAMMRICEIAFNLGLTPDNIQIARHTSEIPMAMVKGLDQSSPNILATIC